MESIQVRPHPLTLVLGASEKPGRYANRAMHLLTDFEHPVVGLGKRPGEVAGQPIYTDLSEVPTGEIDTITLYLNPRNQEPYFEDILRINPRRIIFNPGTENPRLAQQARTAGIEVVFGCTLVMLHTGRY